VAIHQLSVLRPPADIDALKVDLRLGKTATGVDLSDRTVTLADGTTVGFDALVIATGVRARRLPGTEGVRGIPRPARRSKTHSVILSRLTHLGILWQKGANAGPRQGERLSLLFFYCLWEAW
jgi:NADPH-dependent 2,4-dienoyl-CoA reductase/sulfur reductase-like enzyme